MSKVSKPLFFSFGKDVPSQEEVKVDVNELSFKNKKTGSSPKSVISLPNYLTSSFGLKQRGFFSAIGGDQQISVSPKQEDSYKISFQDLEQSSSGRAYNDSTAQITISVGCSHRHSGSHFRDTLKKVAQTFKKAVIMVDDSVQWRTLAIDYPDYSEQQLRELAIANGDRWLAEHQQSIDQYTNVTVVRWKNFEINHLSRYNDAVAKMKVLYETVNYNGIGKSHPIKAAIDLTAQEFLKRQQKREGYDVILQSCTEEKIVCLSRDYLIEECAIMAEFWPELGTHYELYPSERTEAMAVTHKYLIKDQYPDLLYPLMIRFNKKKMFVSTEDLTDSNGNSPNTCQF